MSEHANHGHSVHRDHAGQEQARQGQARLGQAGPPDGGQRTEWRCFHCGDLFTDRRLAAIHFGADDTAEAACRIKAGAEGSLVEALRRAERDAADAWHAIHTESTEAAKTLFAQAARHQEQLRTAEDLGYERGLADARKTEQNDAGGEK